MWMCNITTEPISLGVYNTHMVGASRKDETEWQDAVADRSLVFDLLADEHRRHAIAYLATCEESVPISELAAEVATRIADRPQTAISTQRTRSIAIDLHHKHVPKLAEAGVVEYDRECGLVNLAEADAVVEGALSLAEAD